MNYNPKVVSFDRSSAYVHHRAMVNRRENNPVDALELMRHAVEQSPENGEYRLDLAELYCEMGCHAQSNRLLLDMLASDDAPAECFYGLALNQIAMNDVEGAKQSLRRYRQADPNGVHGSDVERLASELDIVEALNRPVNRRLYRAMRVADHACDTLQSGDPARAKRLFERSLSLSSEQYEMRAMYALTLMMCGEGENAVREAERASAGFPPSVRALCVSSQVFAALGNKEKARELLERALGEHPNGVELRLLIFTLGEIGMHDQLAECARIALQETPYDRQLLHIRAAALHRLGMKDEQVEKFWQRILRIDPDDSIAKFYRDACVRGDLGKYEIGYAYQVPEEEFRSRAVWLAGILNEGMMAARARWSEDAHFRRMVLWAAQCDDEKLRRAAVTVIAAMDDESAQSSIRSLMFGGNVQPELKRHAALLLKLRGADIKRMFPADSTLENTLIPAAHEILNDMSVGDRQLIRYAADMLEDHFGMTAASELALMWAAYRSHRGLRSDPLINSAAASAALVYNYLLLKGKRSSFEEMSGLFGCSMRRMIFYASRIADILERSEGETKDEDLRF